MVSKGVVRQHNWLLWCCYIPHVWLEDWSLEMLENNAYLFIFSGYNCVTHEVFLRKPVCHDQVFGIDVWLFSFHPHNECEVFHLSHCFQNASLKILNQIFLKFKRIYNFAPTFQAIGIVEVLVTDPNEKMTIPFGAASTIACHFGSSFSAPWTIVRPPTLMKFGDS